MPTLIKTLSMAALMAGLIGCSSTTQLPNDGPTVKEIYDRNMASNTVTREGSKLSAARDERNLAGYTRYAFNEAQSQFRRLPNPEVFMYVYPHLSSGNTGSGIPGYTTTFPLYDRVHYALPGETIDR